MDPEAVVEWMERQTDTISGSDPAQISAPPVTIEGAPVTMTPAMDMQSLDYVQEPDPNLVCLICRTPFVDPVILGECDHCFCRDCLAQAWDVGSERATKIKGSCPTCRARTSVVGDGTVSRILVNILDDLAVHCPASGCSATPRRGEVEDHVRNYCGHTEVVCTKEGCEEKIERRHASACLHTDILCEDCGEAIREDRMEQHGKKDCPALDREIGCAHCGTALAARRQDQHLRHSCPETTETCPGAVVGCRMSLKRSLLTEHVSQCTLATLAPVMEAQMKQVADLQEQTRLANRKMGIMESGIKRLERLVHSSEAQVMRRNIEVQSSRDWWTSPDALTSGDGLPPPDNHSYGESSQSPFPHVPATSAVTPYTHLLSLHESLRDEVSRVSTALHDLEGRHSMMILNENLRVREELAYMGGQVGGLGRQVGWLTSMRLHGEAGVLAGTTLTGASPLSGGSAGGSGMSGPSVAAEEGEKSRNTRRLARRSTDEGRVKL